MTIFFVSFTSPSSTGSIVRLIKLRFALNGLAQGRLPRLWLMQKNSCLVARRYGARKIYRCCSSDIEAALRSCRVDFRASKTQAICPLFLA